MSCSSLRLCNVVTETDQTAVQATSIHSLANDLRLLHVVPVTGKASFNLVSLLCLEWAKQKCCQDKHLFR